MDFYKNNVLVPANEIENIVANEKPLNNHHEGVIIHSEAFNLNAHAKYKILRANIAHKMQDNVLRIFVPNKCSKNSLVNLLSDIDSSAEIELDIRSYTDEGAGIIELFKPFLQQCIFDVKYNANIESMLANNKVDAEIKGKVFKKMYFCMQSPYVTHIPPILDIVKGRFSASKKVSIIVNKKTLHDADIYSAIVLTYFSTYFNIIGELPSTYNKVFRMLNVDNVKFRACISEIMLSALR